MRTRHALFALVSVVLLGLSPFATSALAAGVGAAGGDTLGTDDDGLALAVTQSDGVSVAVTDNGSAVANATVTVTALNNSTYAGEGDYHTSANGTVALPMPEANVTVSVEATADGQRTSETVTLRAIEAEERSDGPFGQRVSLYVQSLLSDGHDGDDASLGRLVSAFVVTNNPGAEHRPEHAGPPEDRGPDDEDDESGESEGDEENEKRRGPPKDEGPNEDEGDERGERGDDSDVDDEKEDEGEGGEEDERTTAE